MQTGGRRGVVRSAKFWRLALSIVVPLLAIAVPVLYDSQEARCGFVIFLMATWWILEPVPLPVTALLPVVMYPLLGILSTQETTTPYMKDTIMMFIGGLIMAVAVEHSNLHKRIALRVVLALGTSLRRLMFGFMMTTMFLSMWISNTATTAMMVPIVEAVLDQLQMHDQKSKEPPAFPLQDLRLANQRIADDPMKAPLPPPPIKAFGDDCEVAVTPPVENTTSHKDLVSKRVQRGLLLSIAYSANCGGTATLTGTGPNLIFKGILEEMYPASNDITFGTWMMYNIPGMLICVFLAFIYLQMTFLGGCACKSDENEESIRKMIRARYDDLGPITFQQIVVLLLFTILLLLWFFIDPKFIPGWADLLNSGVQIKDSTPAIAVAVLLFLLPADLNDPIHGPRVLTWDAVHHKLPWGIIILVGGGFAMSEGSKKSGLFKWLARKLSIMEGLPPEAVVFIVCLVTAGFTEVVSNSAAANVFLPVLTAMAQPLQVNPIFLTLPVAVTCSFAFMLPAATPPNAIVFSSGKMKTWDMAKPGFFMNIICCIVQFGMINTLGVAMFDLHTFPAWAYQNSSSPLTPH